MVNYAEKYGLPKDRMKLEAGLSDFSIVKIELIDSKKSYDTREEGIDGNIRITKKKIKIAYIDIIRSGEKEIEKFYSPNTPIVEACKNMLHDYGKPNGELKEPVFINEVKEGIGESKNPYLFFA